jgi:hypothetical protein
MGCGVRKEERKVAGRAGFRLWEYSMGKPLVPLEDKEAIAKLTQEPYMEPAVARQYESGRVDRLHPQHIRPSGSTHPR